MNSRLSKFAFIVLLTLTAARSCYGQWTPTSYGIFQGQSNTIFGYGGTVFLGTTSGIFVSTDNGASWHLSNSGLANSNIISFAALGGDIFAGTVSGVFVSHDNGGTWSLSGLTDTYIASFCTSGTSIFAGTYAGIYRSTDHGVSWTQVSNGLLPGGISANALVTAGTNIFAGDSNGEVFISSDQGDHWSKTSFSAFYIYTLFYDGTFLFAGTNTGLFRSGDMGTTWTNIKSGFTDVLSSAMFGGKIIISRFSGLFSSADNGMNWGSAGFSGAVRAVTTTSTNLFLVDTNGSVFLSTDSGLNWNPVNNGLQRTGSDVMIASGNTIFAGTYLGIQRSLDSGTTWAQANSGLTTTSITSLAIQGTRIFAGTDPGGVFISDDNGTTWTASNNGLTNASVTSLAVSTNRIFAGTNAGLFMSADGGSSWLKAAIGNATISSVTTKGNDVFAALHNVGFFYSSDEGSNWIQRNPSYGVISKLIVAGNVLYAAAFAGVYASINQGTSWIQVGGPALDTDIEGMTPFGNNLFLSDLSGNVYLYAIGSLVQLNSGLPFNRRVPAFAVSGTTVFAAVNSASGGPAGSVYSMSTLVFPTITSISLSHGPVGVELTINGSNFGPSIPDNKVQFNTTNANILQASSTSLRVIVPNTYAAAKIKVTVGALSVTSLTDFQIDPSITSFSPTSGYQDTYVTIHGSGFAPSTYTAIKFNNLASFAYANSGTLLTTTVPSGATTGPISVVVNGQSFPSTSIFTVLPMIASFSPTSGPVGTPVSVFGSGFDPVAGNNIIKFNGIAATVTSSNFGTINTTVPAGVSSGPISLSVNGNFAISHNAFILFPIPSFCFSIPPQPEISITGNDTDNPILTSSSSFGNQWFLNDSPINAETDQEFSPVESGNYTVQVTDLGCAGPVSEIKAVTVVTITGLTTTQDEEENLKVFPNPAPETLTISLETLKLNQKVKIEIYDATGHQLSVLEGYGGSQMKIPLSQYAEGLYLIRARQSGKTYSARFIKL